MIPLKRLTAAALAFVAFSSNRVHAQAEVHLQNGSVLYGEVKGLEFAKLSLDTDDFDLVEIDWDPIVYLKAPGPFVITLADGASVTGGLEVDSVNVTISGDTPMAIPRSDIGSFKDFDTGFWNQVSAGVDLGANVVRGNNKVTALSTGVNLGYETDVTEIATYGTLIINEQDDAPSTRRYTAGAFVDRRIAGPLRLGVGAAYERDENQMLEYRVPLAAFASYRVISYQRTRLDLVVGGGPTFEKYTGGESESLGEGKAGFRFIGKPDGDTTIDISSYASPGLFDLERVRVDTDAVLRFEIITDLDLNITAYHRFNSEPPVDVKKNDYGLTLGLGWSY